MKSVALKILSLLLATLMLLSTLVACGVTEDHPSGESTAAGEAATEGETVDPTKQALEDLVNA